jgi:hypothetical protein
MGSMLSSYHGLRSLSEYFVPAPYRQFKELYYHGPRKNNYFKYLGAKYLICLDCGTDATTGYTLVENLDGYSIYEASDALLHTYIIHMVETGHKNLQDFTSNISMMKLPTTSLFPR